MHAVRLHDARDLRLDTVDLSSAPQAGEIRLRVAFAGICGSDIHNFKTGRWLSRKPSTAGHEFSGIVEAIGPGVTGFETHEKVVADSRDYCGQCAKCRMGKHHVCENLGFVGESRDGGFAEFVDLPVRLVFKCEPSAPLDVMALAEPLAVALHALAKIRLDDGPVFIIGCGSIGALSAMASMLTSDRKIFLCDQNLARVNYVADLCGARVASVADIQSLSKKPDTPVAHVLDTTGNVAVIQSVLKTLTHGTLGFVGIGSGSIDFDPVQAVERELSIVGCHAFADEFPQAIDLLQKYSPQFQPLIAHRIKLDEVPMEFEKIVNGQATGVETLIEIDAS